jgi:hypothetical protein
MEDGALERRRMSNCLCQARCPFRYEALKVWETTAPIHLSETVPIGPLRDAAAAINGYRRRTSHNR